MPSETPESEKEYTEIGKCREIIQDYGDHIDANTDDNDDDKLNESTASKYKGHIRWYNDWLDDVEIDEMTAVGKPDAGKVGYALAKQYNGSTGRYRWEYIRRMHDWMVRMEYIDENPFRKWDPKEDFSLTKSTEQGKHLEEGEDYAVSQDDVRLMEDNVGRHRIRDQLIVRVIWQTGMRRGELEGLELRDIDREKREITIRAAIAKNGKKRIVAYQPSLDGLLSQWLDYGHRDEMTATTDHDHLLAGERGAPLSDKRINEIIVDAARRAGINRLLYPDANAPEPEDEDEDPEPNRWKISAHNVRHGYGSYMINEAPKQDGEDGQARLWETSRQLGHESVAITEEIYVEEDPRAGIGYAHTHGPE